MTETRCTGPSKRTSKASATVLCTVHVPPSPFTHAFTALACFAPRLPIDVDGTAVCAAPFHAQPIGHWQSAHCCAARAHAGTEWADSGDLSSSQSKIDLVPVEIISHNVQMRLGARSGARLGDRTARTAHVSDLFQTIVIQGRETSPVSGRRMNVSIQATASTARVCISARPWRCISPDLSVGSKVVPATASVPRKKPETAI